MDKTKNSNKQEKNWLLETHGKSFTMDKNMGWYPSLAKGGRL